MSIFLFLAPVLLGITLTGISIVDDALSEDNIKKYINDSSTVYATNMRDKDLLKEALNEYGMKVVYDNTFKALTDKGNILFLENEKGNYNIIFNGTFSYEEISSFSEDISEYYNSLVQERTYQKLLEQVRKNNYELENEIITEDSSIVLTIRI